MTPRLFRAFSLVRIVTGLIASPGRERNGLSSPIVKESLSLSSEIILSPLRFDDQVLSFKSINSLIEQMAISEYIAVCSNYSRCSLPSTLHSSHVSVRYSPFNEIISSPYQQSSSVWQYIQLNTSVPEEPCAIRPDHIWIDLWI